jgi:tetratricopeptide (TPR) repeat protein
MIQKITEYLIRKKRIQDCLNFLLPLQEEDPLIVTHVSDVLLSVDKNKEAILLLAEKIREYPYLVPLLLKQAQSFIKSEYYEYAYKLSKICVDLCPESFEAWFQMAEVYFYMKKIKMSLIAMDIAPYYPDAEWVHRVELVNDYDFSIPRHKKTTDVHPYLLVEPTKVDFRKTGEDPI